jgi:hypothetical protein
MAGKFVPNGNFLAELKQDVVDPNLEARADAVLAAAKANPHDDTGAYERSLRKEETPNGWGISANVEYAAFLEFGTRNMEAYRILGRALDAAKDV